MTDIDASPSPHVPGRPKVVSATLAVALVLLAVLGVALNPRRIALPEKATSGQLLLDGSFELAATSPWVGRVGGPARSGARGATVRPPRPLRQDIAIAAIDGHTYRAEAWVRGTGNGLLTIMTRCPKPESVTTPIRATGIWTQISATLDARHGTGCSLGVEIAATHGDFAVDDSSVIEDDLPNGSFETPAIPWDVAPAGASTTATAVPVADAVDGTHVLRMTSAAANGSVGLEIPLDRSSEPFEATLSVMLRSVGPNAVPVDVAVWGRCPGHDENQNRHLQVSRAWREVRVTFRFSARVEAALIRPDGDPCRLRPEIYLRQRGTIELDAATLSRRIVRLRRR